MNKQQPLKVIAGTPYNPLVIGEVEIPCYVLEDETRVLSQRGFQSSVGLSAGGAKKTGAPRMAEFVGNLEKKGININDLTARLISTIEFQPPDGGRTAYAYPATLLVDVCNVVLAARDAKVLTKQQAHIAERCDLLVRALAAVGIIALVDEATGYQRIREERALSVILEKFIAKELQPWTKTFPYEFYEQIFRLKKWSGPDGVSRPSVIGRYTNDIVYARIAPGVLKELQQRNPVAPEGHRKHKHHQWFTPSLGHPKLKEHLAAVIALMRSSPNWNDFKGRLTRAFPKEKEQMLLGIED